MERNIDLTGTSLPRTLRELRARRGLSQAALGERTGKTERTIGDIENGIRTVIQEDTLFRLAEALGVEPEILVGKKPGRVRVSLFVAVPAILITVGAAFFLALPVTGWRVKDGGLRIAGVNRLGAERWSRGFADAATSFAEWPSGPDRRFAVGFGGGTRCAGSVVAFDMSSGDTLWTDSPNLLDLEGIFTHQLIRDGGFVVSRFLFADLEGDGDEELIACFRQERWFPEFVKAYRRDGTVLGTYHHFGHFGDVISADVDRDGMDEVIAAGTNPKRAGATVVLFDREHFSGAAVDEFFSVRAGPAPEGESAATRLTDNSLVRVVFPNFPDSVMEALDASRIHAADLRVIPVEGGDLGLAVTVGARGGYFFVTMDSRLRPLSAVPADDPATEAAAAGSGTLERTFREPADIALWLGAAWRRESVPARPLRRTATPGPGSSPVKTGESP